MRKFSYLLILAGILIMLYPTANEWYNDRQQEKLLETAELSTADSTPQPDLKSRYAEVTQLLAEESVLDAQAQPQPQETEKPEPEIAVGGKVIALIEIDKIDLKLPVLEGATKANMKHAAAHMKETAPLGEIGNVAIAAHRARTTGRLFNRLNEVVVGDVITIKTSDQVFNYEVYDISVVDPVTSPFLTGMTRIRFLP